MLFVVRKILDYLIRPLPLFVLVLLAVGFKRRRLSCVFAAFALYAMGISPVADLVLRPLEGVKGACGECRGLDHVVVLTGGFFTRGDPVSSTGCSSMKRLVGALSVCRRLGNCTLVLSGGSVGGSPAGAEVWEELLRSLGGYRTVVEASSRTTVENALFVRRVVGNSTFCLVTSAYHMRRALMLFRHLGMSPVPCPTDFLVERRYTLSDFFPSHRNIKKLEVAVHEYVALAYYWVKFKLMSRLPKGST